MELKTLRQTDLIVNSFARVFKTGNIENLTKQAYDFIMLSSGFIAHYNHGGFKCEYENVSEFGRQILARQQYNQWSNFRPGERDYEYMMQKKDIYNRICKLISDTVES